MRKARLFFVLITLIICNTIIAQIGINSDGSTPDASAILDLKSNDKGMLIPRMTQTEIAAISNPASGLLVFNTSDNFFYIYILVDNRWREINYGSSEISLSASYSIGSGNSCANTTINGTYSRLAALDVTNTINIDVTVTTVGTWSVTTNTVNGYSFSGSGIFTTNGTVQIMLEADGTPIVPQTDNFTATANGSGGTCDFDVTVTIPNCGTLTYGGQSYTTVEIGAQCWMAENLNIGTMINSSTSQTNNSIIEKYCYDNTTSNCDTYGGLYQWNEIMQYVTTEGTQGICPTGWHLPSSSEWTILTDLLGGMVVAGGKMKEAGTTHWVGTSGATNESGFTALPGGRLNNSSSFQSIGNWNYLWSSSEYSPNPSSAHFKELMYWSNIINGAANSKSVGHSVRCIKD